MSISNESENQSVNLQHLASPEVYLKDLEIEEGKRRIPRSDDSNSPIDAVARYWTGTQKKSEGLPEMLVLHSDIRGDQAEYFGHTMFPKKIRWFVSNMDEFDMEDLYNLLEPRLPFLGIAVVFAEMKSVEDNPYLRENLQITQGLFGPDRVFILADDFKNRQIVIDSYEGSILLRYCLSQMKEAQNIVAEYISRVIHPNLKNVLMPPGRFRKPELIVAAKFPYVRIKKNYPYSG